MPSRYAVTLFAAAALAACSDAAPTAPLPSAALSAASAAVGGVFTSTNGIAGNAVVAYDRAADGTLSYVGTYATGGLGIGGVADPLASQYALTLSRDAKFLFVVNAGSNSVSSFAVDHGSLSLVGSAASGGDHPISLAASATTLYVLNGNSNLVTGFWIGADGTLTPRADVVRPLSPAATGAAVVRLSRDGRFLSVAERTSNSIDTYEVDSNGALHALHRNASAGLVPFGFDYTATGKLVVSEAGSGSVSSYAQARDGHLTAINAVVPTLQRAPCWLIVDAGGRFAYTANAGSATLTGFHVTAQGSLRRLTTTGVSANLGAGAQPLDLDMSRDGNFLYVFKNGTGTIQGLAVDAEGKLTSLGDVSQGLAARSGYMGLAAF